ncbi:MAG TPA: nitroreductase family protein [Candidatus Limnocylindrales bacterium]|nr:nitroreductase family protein [Candidatus Limnocylindrales bacterium]
MSATPPTPDEILRPLRRTRQIREFDPTPLDRMTIDALVDVARWTGSGRNSQPWRFLVLTERSTLDAVRDLGLPQTRGLATAVAAIAIALPSDPGSAISDAYDEGRVAERLLVAATMLGLGGGISWIRSDVRAALARVLGIPDDWMVRTIVQLGHPSEGARAPKSAPGQGRLPRDQVVFEGRWPSE